MTRLLLLSSLFALALTGSAAGQELSSAARKALLDPPPELSPEVARELREAWELQLEPFLLQAWGREAYELESVEVESANVGGVRRVVLSAQTLLLSERDGATDDRLLNVALVVGGQDVAPAEVFELPDSEPSPENLGELEGIGWKGRRPKSWLNPETGRREQYQVSEHTIAWGHEADGLVFRTKRSKGQPGRFGPVDVDQLTLSAERAASAAKLGGFLAAVEPPLGWSLLEANPSLTGVPLDGADSAALAELDIERKALTADGVSRAVLRVQLPGPGTVSMTASPGRLERLAEGLVVAFEGGHVTYALYTAPDGGDSARLEVSWTPPGGEPRKSVEAIPLVAPPVVLVHGLAEEPQALWEPLATRLAASGRRVWLVDYRSLEGPAAQRQRALWDGGGGEGIQAALKALRGEGVIAAQADVVTHGEGVWIARLWLQGALQRRASNYQQGDVRRLITLAAPHLGSDLARGVEVVVAERGLVTERAGLLEAWLSDSQREWAAQLAPGSEALRSLSELQVSVHAIAGFAREFDLVEGPGGEPVLRALLALGRCLAARDDALAPLLAGSDQQALEERLRAALAGFAWDSEDWLAGPTGVEAREPIRLLRQALFGGTQNDGVIRVESQWGGLDARSRSTFPGIPHGRAPADARVAERVVQLLSGSEDLAPTLPKADLPLRNLQPR